MASRPRAPCLQRFATGEAICGALDSGTHHRHPATWFAPAAAAAAEVGVWQLWVSELSIT
jgi:hypothetical protein